MLNFITIVIATITGHVGIEYNSNGSAFFEKMLDELSFANVDHNGYKVGETYSLTDIDPIESSENVFFPHPCDFGRSHYAKAHYRIRKAV